MMFYVMSMDTILMIFHAPNILENVSVEQQYHLISQILDWQYMQSQEMS